jgi:hypothetical protein
MKTQETSTVNVQKNKVLGIYTVFMVSLSISYIVTTWVQHFTL